jgi:hypothetical protein
VRVKNIEQEEIQKKIKHLCVFGGAEFRKYNHETFKRVQDRPEITFIFLSVACCKKK